MQTALKMRHQVEAHLRREASVPDDGFHTTSEDEKDKSVIGKLVRKKNAHVRRTKLRDMADDDHRHQLEKGRKGTYIN